VSLPSFGPFISKGDVALYHLLKSQDTSAPAKEPVPLESLHPRKGSWDAPDLDKKLLNALADELQRLRDAGVAVERQLARLKPNQAKTARIHHRPFPEEIACAEATTLEELKQGKLGLRAKVLQAEFIEHHRLDPEEIELDFLQFCRWIRLEAKRLDDETLARLAVRIRYKIHFADNTGCWLENIDERPLTSLQEHQDFDGLESVPKTPVHDQVVGSDLQNETASRLYSIRDKGTHFEIVWAGHVLTAKRTDGVRYLTKFLVEPATQWTAIRLYQEVAATVLPDEQKPEGKVAESQEGLAGDADREQAGTNLKELRKRQAELKPKIEELLTKRKGEGLLDEEVRELEGYMAELLQLTASISEEHAVAQGRKLRDKDDEAKKRDSIKRRINEALRELAERYAGKDEEKPCTEFCGHVRMALMNEFVKEFRYEPDPKLGIHWA